MPALPELPRKPSSCLCSARRSLQKRSSLTWGSNPNTFGLVVGACWNRLFVAWNPEKKTPRLNPSPQLNQAAADKCPRRHRSSDVSVAGRSALPGSHRQNLLAASACVKKLVCLRLMFKLWWQSPTDSNRSRIIQQGFVWGYLLEDLVVAVECRNGLIWSVFTHPTV